MNSCTFLRYETWTWRCLIHLWIWKFSCIVTHWQWKLQTLLTSSFVNPKFYSSSVKLRIQSIIFFVIFQNDLNVKLNKRKSRLSKICLEHEQKNCWLKTAQKKLKIWLMLQHLFLHRILPFNEVDYGKKMNEYETGNWCWDSLKRNFSPRINRKLKPQVVPENKLQK